MYSVSVQGMTYRDVKGLHGIVQQENVAGDLLALGVWRRGSTHLEQPSKDLRNPSVSRILISIQSQGSS